MIRNCHQQLTRDDIVTLKSGEKLDRYTVLHVNGTQDSANKMKGSVLLQTTLISILE